MPRSCEVARMDIKEDTGNGRKAIESIDGNVGIAIINHLPFITIFMGGIV